MLKCSVVSVTALAALLLFSSTSRAEYGCYSGKGWGDELQYVDNGEVLSIALDDEGTEMVAEAPGTFLGFFVQSLRHCDGSDGFYTIGVTEDANEYYLDEWLMTDDGQLKSVTRFKAIRLR